MTNVFKLMCVCTATLLFTSCNDPVDPDECVVYSGALEANEIPFVGTWNLTAITSSLELDITDDSEDNPSVDFYNQYSDCQKDAVYSFGSDRAYSFNQGQIATECTQEEKFNQIGTWQIASNELYITNTCTAFRVPLVLAADETEFTFVSEVTVFDVNEVENQVILTYTYTKS